MDPAPAKRADYSARLVAAISAIVALAMLLCIVWAASVSSVLDGLRYLASDRWGIVTLLDVYAGALVVAIWMWVCERRLRTWCLWVVALLCLGHLVSLTYLLVRISRSWTLLQVFTPARIPPRGGLQPDIQPSSKSEGDRRASRTNLLM
jgi:hypothetical protein